MASIETRQNKSGPVHWVRWRKGGKASGKAEGERFTDMKLAKKFQKDVEYYGHEYPPNFVPRHGYVTEGEMRVLQDLAIRATTPSMPFLDGIAYHIDHLTGVQPKTKTDYYALANNYFATFPKFAAADWADPVTLTEDEVAEWVLWMEAGERDPDSPDAWLRTPKSPKTIANAHGLLFSAARRFSSGSKALRMTNPCERTTLPSLDDALGEEMVFLTGDEYELLRAAAKPKHRPTLDAFVGTGMRFSEVAAQQKRDYTPKVETRVDRSWKMIAGQKRELGPPKSERGRRRISLDELTDEAFAQAAHRKSGEDFLFTADQGGPLRHNHFYLLCWQPTIYRAVRCEEHRARDREHGMEIGADIVRLRQIRDLRMFWLRPCLCEGTLTKVPRIHDARHTHAAWCISKGVPLGGVSRRLGHKDAAFTDQQYGHLLPEVDRRAADAIGSIRRAARR
jgi:integrase